MKSLLRNNSPEQHLAFANYRATNSYDKTFPPVRWRTGA